MHASLSSALFGLGYGYPIESLNPFIAEGRFIQAPHNDFFYALGFTGRLGVGLFAILQIEIWWPLWRGYQASGQPFGLMCWATYLTSAMFTEILEGPFGAIPFYLLVWAAIAPGLLVRKPESVHGAQRRIGCMSGRSVMHNIYDQFQRRFRPKRLRLFYSSFQITKSTRVLDLGGGLFFWELAKSEGFPVPQVTVLNIRPGPARLLPELNWVLGDAKNTGFEASSFDIVFSNSLVEHLFDWDSQVRFANEVKRLAPSYFVQTPNRWFFVEPHFVTPFIHWVPKPVRRGLGPRATLWGWVNGAARERYNEMLREIRLLGMDEMHDLFPEAKLVGERWMGMVKSIVAVKRGHQWG